MDSGRVFKKAVSRRRSSSAQVSGRRGGGSGDGPFNLVSGIVFPTGTYRVKFKPVQGKDTATKNDVTYSMTTLLHCVTGMFVYMDKSLEELRLEDYKHIHVAREAVKKNNVNGGRKEAACPDSFTNYDGGISFRKRLLYTGQTKLPQKCSEAGEVNNTANQCALDQRLVQVEREVKLLQQRMFSVEQECENLQQQLTSKDKTIASLNHRLQRVTLNAEQTETFVHREKPKT